MIWTAISIILKLESNFAGLWNMIFLCSNLSLFVGLPFAYLFTESEGFPGSKKVSSKMKRQSQLSPVVDSVRKLFFFSNGNLLRR